MPNSNTGMTSEQVMKIQQLTCQQTLSVALVLYVCQREVLKWATLLGEHFKWAISLTNETIQRVQQVFLFFNFLMAHQNWRSATRGLTQIWLQDNKEIKIMAILLHVSKPIEPIN
jgi:hypothetical protein